MVVVAGNIPNENPTVHWGFFNVKDRVVLDLGCGKFYSPISTAEFFINQGASKVIGVDLSDINYSHPDFTMIVKRIESREDIESLMKEHSPHIIKCDIEGAEKYLSDIPLYKEVDEFAVEYHDNFTKMICEEFVRRWRFKNVEIYQLLGEDINRIGVIHAWNY